MRLALAVILGLVMSVGSAAGEEAWRENAITLAKAEKKVIDATWAQAISFWVSVADDGTRRDGFAEYLCLVLTEAGRPAGEFVVVKVWDHAAMVKDNLKEIGRAECR